MSRTVNKKRQNCANPTVSRLSPPTLALATLIQEYFPPLFFSYARGRSSSRQQFFLAERQFAVPPPGRGVCPRQPLSSSPIHLSGYSFSRTPHLASCVNIERTAIFRANFLWLTPPIVALRTNRNRIKAALRISSQNPQDVRVQRGAPSSSVIHAIHGAPKNFKWWMRERKKALSVPRPRNSAFCQNLPAPDTHPRPSSSANSENEAPHPPKPCAS